MTTNKSLSGGRASLPAKDCEKIPEGDEVHKTRRRRLPHWTLAESIYFLTWRLAKDQVDLVPLERDLVFEALKYFNNIRYQLFCFVVMNDHVHVLFRLKRKEILEKVIHSWKSYTANRLQVHFDRHGVVWQDDYFDRIVRNEKQFYRFVKYILNNPYKRWKVKSYRWAWYQSPDGGHGGPPSEDILLPEQ